MLFTNPIVLYYWLLMKYIMVFRAAVYYPLHASGTPPQTTTGGASNKKKRVSQFQRIDRQTQPIYCGGLNQRESVAVVAAQQRNIGRSLAAARRQWQHQRRWRQRASVTLAETWQRLQHQWQWWQREARRRCTAQRRQREAWQRCTAQRWQRGCSSVDTAAVAAAR